MWRIRTAASRRVLWGGGVLLGAMLLVVFAHVPILRALGSFLIIEDPLQTAVAIVALGGQAPFREIEAAKLYHEGWAPLIFIVREAASDESKALAQLGIKKAPDWELSRDVLVRQGVPVSAIIFPKSEGRGTLEELQAVYQDLQSKDRPVILVTSKYHTRRVRLTCGYVTHGESASIIRAAEGDPFDPARWWRERRFVLSVVREYLGLINYYAGFPVAP